MPLSRRSGCLTSIDGRHGRRLAVEGDEIGEALGIGLSAMRERLERRIRRTADHVDDADIALFENGAHRRGPLFAFLHRPGINEGRRCLAALERGQDNHQESDYHVLSLLRLPRVPVLDTHQIGIVGMLDQHARHPLLPELGKAHLFVRRRRA